MVLTKNFAFAGTQDLESQVTAGEEELGQVKRQAEETEGNLRQTVEQLNDVSFLDNSLSLQRERSFLKVLVPGGIF